MWKYGFASVAGTSHLKAALPCQDASRAEIAFDQFGQEVLIAVVSDGAGSAAQAQLGSVMAAEFFIAKVKTHFDCGGSWEQLGRGFIENWIAAFQQTAAGWISEGATIQEFACTLLAAVIGNEQAIYFHLGDGAIVEEQNDLYHCASWPQQGEYANTTHFLTDADAASKIVIELKNYQVDEIALFTDGIQNLVLDYRNQSAHSPFFAPLFGWLRPRPNGFSQELADSLATYLNSEKFNARTDDDKTLLLATRR
ncbi:MAG TPA: PP2C family serine/threonine-protein phosphatase [Blastocatellia bacterium]|nr:PP2C family serine/threonine-protein phosphatase [Blastocatellia bacterium]